MAAAPQSQLAIAGYGGTLVVEAQEFLAYHKLWKPGRLFSTVCILSLPPPSYVGSSPIPVPEERRVSWYCNFLERGLISFCLFVFGVKQEGSAIPPRSSV